MSIDIEIIKGPYGFCFGVENAVKSVTEHLKKGELLFTDGELVHNKNVLQQLKTLGLKYIENEFGDIKQGTFVVRAHGLPPEKLSKAAERFRILNLTCPIVERLFELGKNLSSSGYKVVVFGKKNHAEMVAFLGYVRDAIITLEPVQLSDKMIAIISQTTSPTEDFFAFVEKMKKINEGKEIRVINTICKVTSERENAAKFFGKNCELVIVVGGKHSSNTKKLFHISSQQGKSIHVEDVNELRNINIEDFFKGSQKIRIGVISGTSTSLEDVEKVVKYLIENYGGRERFMDDFNQVNKVSEFSQEEVPAEESFEKLLAEYESGSQIVGRGRVVEGIVTEISPTGLTVDLGSKLTGVVPLEELFKELNEYRVGEKITVRVEKINEEDGTALLSAKKPMERIILQDIQSAYENQRPVYGRIIERIKAGYRVLLENVVEAFLPGSESNIKEGEEFLREKMQFAVISYEMRGRKPNIVVSRKKLFQKLVDDFFSNRKPGDVVEGIVEEITDKGAYVKIAGVINGFIPNSEVSYNSMQKAKDVLTVGKVMKFLIKDIALEKKRVFLSLKALLPDPWEKVQKKYQTGQVVTGVVTSVKPFGFYVKVEDGIEGFVPIEEVFWKKKGNISEVVSVGDLVKVQVLDINNEKKLLKLSYKSIIGDPWENIAKKLPEGSIAEGKVIKILPNGAIIEIEPEVTAFCNISEVSWNFVDDIEDVIKEQDQVKFKILSVDVPNRKIRVSIRKAKENPWEIFAKRHKEGDIVKAKVIKITEKGYIGLCEDIEVYIPKSQVYENLSINDEIDGKIIKLEPQKDIYKVIVSQKAYENSLANTESNIESFGRVTMEGKVDNVGKSDSEKQSTDSADSGKE
ncbi:MAG: bifunctional 4-hydroxy-3-methylbut-2-enyl diphosphate reductase/30S ribosomal protein S1 [Fervidobacterium sp.]